MANELEEFYDKLCELTEKENIKTIKSPALED